MSEEATTPPEGGAPSPLAGERLAEARRARETPIQEIARELHLDEYKVHALEQNEFEKLGAPVFVKGYLKKYAGLVGVPVDDIVADYYRLNRPASAPLIIPRRARAPRDVSPGPWLSALAVVVVVAGAAWWWLSSGSERVGSGRDSSTLAPFVDDRGPEPLPTADQPAPDTLPDTETAESDTAEREDAAAEPAGGSVEAQSGSEPPQAGGAGQVELRVTFSGDCWTEVTDASGERLYFGLGTAGRAVTVSGVPPLQVLLGNSANASLSVDGSNYPIPRSAQRGDTARLTITEP
jgi:cytoskeleton protein RodZ